MKAKEQTQQPIKEKIKIPNVLIAEHCGFTPQYVGMLLDGKRTNPESLQIVINSIQQIAEELTNEYNIKMPKKKVA